MTATAEHDAAAAVDALDYPRDNAVSREVYEEIVTTLSRGQKKLRKIVEDELRDRDIVAEFGATLETLGLRTNNLADSMTGFWVVMWTIIHDAPLPSKTAVAAVRDQVIARLKGNRSAKDVRKRQLMGEGMVYEAHIALQTYEQARREGNTFQLRQMAKSARVNMKKKGIDLGSMRITDSGLQKP